MSESLKEQFFKGFERRWKEIPSGFGELITIGNVSEAEHQAIEREISKLRKKNDDNIRLVYLKWGCWLSDKSARMFNAEDIKRIAGGGIDYAIVRNICDAIYDHFGVLQQDIDEMIAAKN